MTTCLSMDVRAAEQSDELHADEAAATLELNPFRTDRESPRVYYTPAASSDHTEGSDEHAQSEEGEQLQSKQNPSREKRNFLALRVSFAG